MLFGESVGAGITVAFSIMADGVFDFLTPAGAMCLRWLMFSVAIATSIHLAYQTHKIEMRDERNRKP